MPKVLLAGFEWKKKLRRTKRQFAPMLKTWTENGKLGGCIWLVAPPKDDGLARESLLSALKDASENDPDPHIRGHAEKELEKIEAEQKS